MYSVFLCFAIKVFAFQAFFIVPTSYSLTLATPASRNVLAHASLLTRIYCHSLQLDLGSDTLHLQQEVIAMGMQTLSSGIHCEVWIRCASSSRFGFNLFDSIVSHLLSKRSHTYRNFQGKG